MCELGRTDDPRDPGASPLPGLGKVSVGTQVVWDSYLWTFAVMRAARVVFIQQTDHPKGLRWAELANKPWIILTSSGGAR